MLKKLRVGALVIAALILHSLAHSAPDSTQYVRWGSQMLQKKNYEDAFKYFNAAVKADNKNAAAYKGLGYAMIGKGEKARALPYLKYSAQLNPNDAQLRQYLGTQGITLPPPSAPAAAASTASDQASVEQPEKKSADPWILGGTVAVLGAIMLFLF